MLLLCRMTVRMTVRLLCCWCTGFSGSSTCESHRTSAASLLYGRALSVPDSQHKEASSCQRLAPQDASPQPIDISLPRVANDPFALQRSQHVGLPAAPMMQSEQLPGERTPHRPSSAGEPDVATSIGEPALGDFAAPLRYSPAALLRKTGEIAPRGSLSEDDADVRLLPDVQQQQLLPPSSSPMLPMRLQDLPQPSTSDAVEEDLPGKPAMTAPDLSSPCQSPPATPMLDLRHVPQQVAVLENRIAEISGHIPSPSKTGNRSFSSCCWLIALTSASPFDEQSGHLQFCVL